MDYSNYEAEYRRKYIRNVELEKGDLVLYTKSKRETGKAIWTIDDVDYDTYSITRADTGSHTSFYTEKENVTPIAEYTPTQLEEMLSPSTYSWYLDNSAIASTPMNNKETKMKDMKTEAVQANVEAAKIAAMITAGGVLNRTILEKVRPQLPMLVRGYTEHALADVLIANVAHFAIANFAGSNKEAQVATEAMMLAAMTQLTASFNIEDLISDILKDVKLPTS